jgi:hypothetical protein
MSVLSLSHSLSLSLPFACATAMNELYLIGTAGDDVEYFIFDRPCEGVPHHHHSIIHRGRTTGCGLPFSLTHHHRLPACMQGTTNRLPSKQRAVARGEDMIATCNWPFHATLLGTRKNIGMYMRCTCVKQTCDFVFANAYRSNGAQLGRVCCASLYPSSN